jgi:hypothetical protein
MRLFSRIRYHLHKCRDPTGRVGQADLVSMGHSLYRSNYGARFRSGLHWADLSSSCHYYAIFTRCISTPTMRYMTLQAICTSEVKLVTSSRRDQGLLPSLLSTNGANSVPPVHPSQSKSNALYVASEHDTTSAWETPLAKATLLVCWASATTPHVRVMAERAAAVALVHPVLLASAHAACTLVVTPSRAL